MRHKGREVLLQVADNRGSRIFHQDNSRNASGNRSPVHLPHFGRGQNFHTTSTQRAISSVMSSGSSCGGVPVANGVNHFRDDQFIVLVSATFYQVDQPFFSKHLPIGIFRLGDAVGVTDKQVARSAVHDALHRIEKKGNAPTTVPLISSDRRVFHL